MKPTRQRGQPSPGKQRRTKAEIAEDEAAENAEASSDPVTLEQVKKDHAEQAAISTTPEDRQDPENPDPVDDEATAEADAADEAAESAQQKSGDAPTHDDIRGILGKYRDVYGMDAAMEDGPVVLQEVCGEGVVKISDVPDDKIAAVLDAIKKAGNENRFDRKQVA